MAGHPLGEGGLAEGASAKAEVEAWAIEGHGEPLCVAAARTADPCSVDDGSSVVDNGRARIGGRGGDRGIGTDFHGPALAQQRKVEPVIAAVSIQGEFGESCG